MKKALAGKDDSSMRSLFEKFQKLALLRAIICLVLGLLLLLLPQTMLNIIVFVLAAYLFIMGLLGILSYFNKRRTSDALTIDFISGLFSALIGLVLALFNRQIIGLIPIILGIFVVLSGALSLTQALDLRKANNRSGRALLIYSLLLIVVGIVAILNPFGSMATLTRLLGVVLLLMGIGDMVTHFTYGKNN